MVELLVGKVKKNFQLKIAKSMDRLTLSFADLVDNGPKSDPEIDKKINKIAETLRNQKERIELSPMVMDFFSDPDFFNALPEEIKNNERKLSELMINTDRFSLMIGRERIRRIQKERSEGSIFGDEVEVPESLHHDGRVRRAESGYKINLDYLREQGIDPTKVLFFRVSQPSTTPKPEYYWTSDYFETQRGLTVEIPDDQRKNAVILVADLETINQNGGLIQDINDDNGLAVRQIGAASFDQRLALTKIKPSVF